MILSKSSSWMHKELMGFASSTVRYCYVQEVLNTRFGRLVISDGFHFVVSTILEQQFWRLMEGYSTESLRLKGSVLLVGKHAFHVSARGSIEMVVEDCIYFGEGSLSHKTKDINKSLTNHSLRLFQDSAAKNALVRPLCRSVVLRFLDWKGLLDPRLVHEAQERKSW